MIPHRTHRPDSNRDEIVKALEEHGWKIINTGMVGEGMCDLLALKQEKHWNNEGLCRLIWRTEFIEIKSPKGTYTPKELKFQDRFPGLVVTLRGVEDVEKL